MPDKDIIEVPVFVHTPENEYVDAPISFEALDEVFQWAKLWSGSCDQSIVKQARDVVKSLESFLQVLDHKCKQVDKDSGGNIYFSGLLGQAEALLASVPKAKRSKRTR